MPVNVPTLPAPKNVSICYNDGRFSYLEAAITLSLSKGCVPGICSLIKPNCVALLYVLFIIQQKKLIVQFGFAGG
jgi:hypothetical protein